MLRIKTQMKKLLLLALFLLGLLPLLLFGNTFLTQTDSVAAMMMHDLKEQKAQTVIVGSSMALYHMNPTIIGKATGRSTFTAAVTGLMPPGAIALTKELLRHSQPEEIVLVLESGSFDTTKEDPMTQMKLAPFLSDPLNRLRYWYDTAQEDGMYAERLLMMNSFGHRDAQDVRKSLRLRFDHEDASADILREWTGEYAYDNGHLRIVGAEPVDAEDAQDWFIRRDTGMYYEVMPRTKEWLLRYRDLCHAHGVRLRVVIAPEMTATVLREAERLTYLDSAQAFFAEAGIPCYNMLYAKESLLPDLNAYYHDYHHMTGEGADILSAAVGRVLAEADAGQDVSGHFSRNRYAYLESIRFMTNVWATMEQRGGQIALHADSNRGASVQPEYSFALVHPDGEETTLRSFGKNPDFSFDPAAHTPRKGSRIRVYGRAPGRAEVFRYDLPLDAAEGTAM
ncbi:MAG: hypothetical protein J6M47_10195 [Clostridia bacterium]|nr:hypothetical protein [Clostridia bacterium]